MEGLIPYVFRVIKRRRTRRIYRTLTGSYEAGSFHSHGGKYIMPPPQKMGGFHEDQGGVHRRHHSMEEFSTRDNYSPEHCIDPSLVGRRGGSMRVMGFMACISGAN